MAFPVARPTIRVLATVVALCLVVGPSAAAATAPSVAAAPARIPATATAGLAAPASAATTAGPAVTVTSTAPVSPAARVVAAARRHLGAPYRFGATGPRSFDCAGLVYHVFADAHLLVRIGGRYRNATAMYRYFASRGRSSRTGGKVGDLVVYGGGSHIGIYIGNGRVISAIYQGVRIHGLRALTVPFTTFLHTRLTVAPPPAAPAPVAPPPAA